MVCICDGICNEMKCNECSHTNTIKIISQFLSDFIILKRYLFSNLRYQCVGRAPADPELNHRATRWWERHYWKGSCGPHCNDLYYRSSWGPPYWIRSTEIAAETTQYIRHAWVIISCTDNLHHNDSSTHVIRVHSHAALWRFGS